MAIKYDGKKYGYCLDCGTDLSRFSKGRCRPCYNKAPRRLVTPHPRHEKFDLTDWLRRPLL